MANYYERRRHDSSIFDVFSLNPLPYPILLILAVIFIFFGISSYISYESVVESAEENFSWILKVIPIVLLILVHFLSYFDITDRWFYTSPYDHRRRTYFLPSEGASPWLVAALIVFLLVMVSYQSTIQDFWSP